MRKIMLLYLTILFSSCRYGEYKFAIIDYKNKGIDCKVRIEDAAKLEILQNGISSLKERSIIIPIEYQLTIGLRSGDTLKYWGDGFVMMDSLSRYYIPEGKAKKDFIELLKSTTRGMKVFEGPL